MLTTRQNNRLTAAENTLEAFQADPIPYQPDKALQTIVQELSQLTTALTPLRQQGLRTKTKGPSRSKTERREQLATAAAEIAGDVYSYGAAGQNRPLQASVDYSYSLLLGLRDLILADTAQHIYDVAEAHLTPLADYAVTPARLQELQDAISSFNAGKNTPRQQVTEGKAARIAIRTQFTALTQLLEERLDRSLRKYARSHPDFYHRLTAARIVIDRPGGHKSSEDGEAPKTE